jgi:hypothetical protein
MTNDEGHRDKGSWFRVKFAALLFCEKFNPDGINRKINSIGQAGQAGFWDNK